MMKNEWSRVMMKSLQGILTAMLLFFSITAIFTLLMIHTALSEQGMPYYVLTAACIACLWAGLQIGLIVGKRGLLTGMLSGAGVFILLLALCVGVGLAEFNTALFRPIQMLSLAFGGIGGIIGTNIKK